MAINSKTLLTTIAEAAGDKKAENIVLLDVRGLASFTDFMVVASGNSDRQVRALGEHIEDSIAKGHGPRVVGREGYEQGSWVLVDYGEVVVHLFNRDQRELFDLESLWAEAPRTVWDPAKPPAQLFAPQSARQVVAAAPARARKAQH